jgi:DNA-binding CsgD family transcriptional regulator
MHPRHGVSSYAIDGRILQVSDAVGGFDEQNLSGQPPWIASPEATSIKAAFAECVHYRTPVDCRSSHAAPDGNAYHFSYTFHRLPDGAAVVSVWHPPMVGQVLDAREMAILRELAEGRTHDEVRDSFKLSERTLSAVLHEIRVKLGARTNTHAAALAVRHGLI